jgi:hypothetical protein
MSFDVEGAKYVGTDDSESYDFRYKFVASADHIITLTVSTTESPFANPGEAIYNLSVSVAQAITSSKVGGTNPVMQGSASFDASRATYTNEYIGGGFYVHYEAEGSGPDEYVNTAFSVEVYLVPVINLSSNATSVIKVNETSPDVWTPVTVAFHGTLIPYHCDATVDIRANGSEYNGDDASYDTFLPPPPNVCTSGYFRFFCLDPSGRFNFTLTFGAALFVALRGPQGKTRYSIRVNSTDFLGGENGHMPASYVNQTYLKLLVSESPAINFTVEYVPLAPNTLETLQVYPTQGNTTYMTLDYQGKGLSSPIHVAVVPDSNFPRALSISFELVGGHMYTSTLDITPSPDGISDIFVNATLNCSTGLCTSSNGLNFPESYTVKIMASSGTYAQIVKLPLQLVKAKWLVMLYAEADSIPNLEPEILYNVEEMINVSRDVPTPQVGMLVLLKLLVAAPGYYAFAHGNKFESGTLVRPKLATWGVASLPAHRTQLYQIVEGKLKKVGPDWVSATDLNLSDYNTLHKFINKSMTIIPAERNQLIIADHGGGIAGVAWDYSKGDKQMSIPSLTRAFQRITPELDVLSFDACLMAQIEVLYNLKDSAKYFTVSDLPSPGYGYAYDEFLAQLSDNPSISTVDYLKVIVSTFGDRYDGSTVVDHFTRKENATLAAVDASGLQAVKTTMDALSNLLVRDYGRNDPTFNYTMNQIIKNTWAAGKNWPYVDAYDFASRLATNTGITDTQLKIDSQDVMAAVSRAVLANVTDYYLRGVRTTAGYHGVTALLWSKTGVEKGIYGVFMKYELGTTFGTTTTWPDLVKSYNMSNPSYFQNLVAVILRHVGLELFLNVYDSAGRHVGINESLAVLSRDAIDTQIPGASYFDFHNGTAEILLPANTTSFRVEVDGGYMQEAQESFNVTYRAFQNGILVSSKTVGASMTQGSVAEASATFQNRVLQVGNFAVTTSTYTPTTSSSGGGSAIPEFPVQFGFTLLATVVIVASYVLARRGVRIGKQPPV